MVIVVFKEIILRQNVNKKTYLKNDCSAKHHTTLHKYLMSNQSDRSKKGRKEDPKQNSSIKREEGKIHSFTGMVKEPSKRFLMQILPVKVKSIDRRTTATYALHMCYVNDSQGTL